MEFHTPRVDESQSMQKVRKGIQEGASGTIWNFSNFSVNELPSTRFIEATIKQSRMQTLEDDDIIEHGEIVGEEKFEFQQAPRIPKISGLPPMIPKLDLNRLAT